MKKVKLFIKPFSIPFQNPQDSSDILIGRKRRGFFDFITSENRNLWLLYTAVGAIILQFLLFKYLYPYPDFSQESHDYIYAAAAHLQVSLQPIGYSKFLSAFPFLTHSDWALVTFQYFFLEISALYLFFTMLYFFDLSKINRNILFIFLFLNPLFLYSSNYINSDALFTALNLLWLAELQWIVQRPKAYQVFTQGVLIFLAFTLHNSAFYYPFISTLAFILSKHRTSTKCFGILLPFLLLVPFIFKIREAAFKLTGTHQFSLLAGWQLANNALYAYDNFKMDSTGSTTKEVKTLNLYSQAFYKNAHSDFHEYLLEYPDNYFILQPESPLKQYFAANYRPNDENDYIADWGKVSIVYADYGKAIIARHPIKYVKHFMLPNIKNFLFPSLEELEVYNLGRNRVDPVTQNWFNYKTPSVFAISKDGQGNLLLIFPYAFFFLNILIASGLGWAFYNKRRIVFSNQFKGALYVASSFLAANFFFCIAASIIVMRSQFFPMIVSLIFSLLLFEALEKNRIATRQINSSSHGNDIKPQLIKI